MKSNKFILSVLITVALTIGLQSTVLSLPRVKSTTKHEDIMRLMEVTKADKIVNQYMDQIVAILKKSAPDEADEMLEFLREEIDMDELADITASVYDKNLSQDEIRELIKFYESPIGRKLIKVLPVIIQDSMAAGQKWAQDNLARILEKFQERLESNDGTVEDSQ